MVEVVWSDAPSEQLDEIMVYVEPFDPAAARHIAEKLFVLAANLSIFPNRGRPGEEPGTRELTTAPPYVVTYEVTGDAVTLLDARHGRMMPRRPRS